MQCDYDFVCCRFLTLAVAKQAIVHEEKEKQKGTARSCRDRQSLAAILAIEGPFLLASMGSHNTFPSSVGATPQALSRTLQCSNPPTCPQTCKGSVEAATSLLLTAFATQHHILLCVASIRVEAAASATTATTASATVV